MVRVFNHWLSEQKAIFFLAEECALVLALLAGASLGPVAANPSGLPKHDLIAAFVRAAPAALAFAGALYLGDLYDLHLAVRDRADGRRLLRALGLAAVVLAFAYLVLPWLGLPVLWISRRNLLVAAAGGAGAVIAVRAALPAVVGKPIRLLFLGTGARALRLAQEAEDEADGLFATVGFVELTSEGVPSGERVAPAPMVYSGKADVLAQRLRAQAVVVAVENRRHHLPLDALLACRTQGIQVMDDAGFAEAALKRIPLSLVRPSSLIFDEGFRVSRANRIAKRTTDLVVASGMLVLLSPVMLAVAAAIALSDGRPVFYRQERTGRFGRPYPIWKFRTMRRDAERAGAAWASQHDPRVLPVGRLLRRSRLDELPQLWNVLRGEMSLVGPRPERPVFVSQLEARYPLFALRALVKPGLTGWAQLRYRYGSTFEEQGTKLEYDLYYIKNMSIFLDLVCLFHTAKIVLSGKGAR